MADLDFFSFVDHAVREVGDRLPAADTDATRLVLSLYRVANTLVYDVESTVHRPRGWTYPGFRILFVLWLAGPLESKRVAELAGMSRANVSALVNTLQRDGLVARTADERDRRAVRVSLSPTGEEAIASAFLAHNARERAWAGLLSDAERRTLVGLLEKLMHGAADVATRRRA